MSSRRVPKCKCSPSDNENPLTCVYICDNNPTVSDFFCKCKVSIKGSHISEKCKKLAILGPPNFENNTIEGRISSVEMGGARLKMKTLLSWNIFHINVCLHRMTLKRCMFIRRIARIVLPPSMVLLRFLILRRNGAVIFSLLLSTLHPR